MKSFLRILILLTIFAGANVVYADAPTIIRVTSTTNSATYKAGDQINLTIQFNQSVYFGASAVGVGLTDTGYCSPFVVDGLTPSTATCTYDITNHGYNGSELNTTGSIYGDVYSLGDDTQLSNYNIPSGYNLADEKDIYIDTVAPNSPTVPTSFEDDTGSSNSDHVTQDTTPAFSMSSGSAEANSTIKIYDGGSLVDSFSVDNSGAWNGVLSGLSEGSHTLTFKAIDAVGNLSASGGSLIVTIDTTPPSAPTMNSWETDTGSSASDTITYDTSLVFHGSSTAESVELFDTDGTTSLGSSNVSGGSWHITTPTLSEGNHTFYIKATDTAGNISSPNSFGITIDVTSPDAPIISSFDDDTGSDVSDHITTDRTITLSGTGEANAVVTIFATSTPLGSVTANGSGAWTYTTGTLPSNTAYSFTANQYDVAGNLSPTSSNFNITIDTTAPSAPVVNSFSDDTGTSNSDHITSDTQPQAGGSSNGDTVSVYKTNGDFVTSVAVATGNWSYDFDSLSEGSYTYSFVALDLAGNRSATSTLSFTIDTTAQVPSIDSFNSDTGTPGDFVTSDNIITLYGTAEADSTVYILDGISSLGSVTADGSGNWSYTTGALSDGQHDFTATIADLAGNSSMASIAYSITIDTSVVAPTVTTADDPDVTVTTAHLFASIDSDGGASISSYGFEYGTVSDLSSLIDTTSLDLPIDPGNFNETITGLTCGTTYYFRAYAGNSDSVGYGDIESFETSACTVLPSVDTVAASSIEVTGATLNGTTTDNGGEDALDHGFAYGTVANLSTVIATTTLGAQTGIGAFSQSVSSLICNTTYYFRAYAVNSIGTSTGSVLSFTTSNCKPTVASVSASSISTTGATLNGTTTATGGQNPTDHGFAYGTVANLSTVIATTTLGSQSGVGAFSQSLSSLTCNTTYYFRAYAVNDVGTSTSASIETFTTDACVDSGGGGGGGANSGGGSGGGGATAGGTSGWWYPLLGNYTLNSKEITNPSSTTEKVQSAWQTLCDLGFVCPKVNEVVGNGESKYIFKKDLVSLQNSSDVKMLQKFLNTHGFPVAYAGVGSLGRETNLFGPATKLALIRFQKANGIKPASGYFGPITRGVINSMK